MLVSGSAHAQLEAHITLQYVQCGTEKSPVEFTRRARSARQLFYPPLFFISGFYTEGGGGPGISPLDTLYSLVLKTCTVSYSCMTLWQCPTNFVSSHQKIPYEALNFKLKHS